MFMGELFHLFSLHLSSYIEQFYESKITREYS